MANAFLSVETNRAQQKDECAKLKEDSTRIFQQFLNF